MSGMATRPHRIGRRAWPANTPSHSVPEFRINVASRSALPWCGAKWLFSRRTAGEGAGGRQKRGGICIASPGRSTAGEWMAEWHAGGQCLETTPTARHRSTACPTPIPSSPSTCLSHHRTPGKRTGHTQRNCSALHCPSTCLHSHTGAQQVEGRRAHPSPAPRTACWTRPV